MMVASESLPWQASLVELITIFQLYESGSRSHETRWRLPALQEFHHLFHALLQRSFWPVVCDRRQHIGREVSREQEEELVGFVFRLVVTCSMMQ
jgi:hypothetical protein